jgi:molybdopterin converting factor subunit 1
MRVLVRLFASYREAAGVGRIELELPPGATVKDAIFRVVKDHPLIAEGRQVVIARNHEYVTPDEPLADGDEVALIPPVSVPPFGRRRARRGPRVELWGDRRVPRHCP